MSSSCIWKTWAIKEHVWEPGDVVSVGAPPKRQLYRWHLLLFHLPSLASSIPTFRVPSPMNTCTSRIAILVFKSGITKNTEHHLPVMTSQIHVGQMFFWLLGGSLSTGQVWPTRGAAAYLLKCISVLSMQTCHSTGPYSSLPMGLLITHSGIYGKVSGLQRTQTVEILSCWSHKELAFQMTTHWKV